MNSNGNGLSVIDTRNLPVPLNEFSTPQAARIEIPAPKTATITALLAIRFIGSLRLFLVKLWPRPSFAAYRSLCNPSGVRKGVAGLAPLEESIRYDYKHRYRNPGR